MLFRSPQTHFSKANQHFSKSNQHFSKPNQSFSKTHQQFSKPHHVPKFHPQTIQTLKPVVIVPVTPVARPEAQKIPAAQIPKISKQAIQQSAPTVKQKISLRPSVKKKITKK